MKRYYKAATTLLAATLLTVGCSGIFDELAINPSQPSMTQFFTTPEAANSAVMTMYGYITTQRCFGASASKISIIRSDEASSNADYGKPGMYGSSLNSSYYTIMQPFGLLYSTASQASFVIENIDKIEFADNKLKNAYKGEAYFMRAFAHYYLLTNYRNVAPIRNMPEESKDYVRKVEEHSAVWDFISEDLQTAKELLPAKGFWGSKNAGRVTSASAAALRGKCFLYRSGIEPLYGGDTKTYYDEAAAEFDEIIKGTYGSFSLVTYAHNFDVAHENNDESIFEMQFLGDVINNNFNPGQATSGLAFDGRGLMLPGTGTGYEAVVHDWLYNEYANSIDKNNYTDIRMFSTLFFNDNDPKLKLRPDQRSKGPNGHTFTEMYPKGNFTSVSNVRAHNYKAASLKWIDLSMPMRNNTATNITGVGAGTQEYIYNQPRAHGVNWRYIRYADVLLMYAEAVVNGAKSGSVSAADAYNEVRNRADMPIKNAITMDDIKKERILEFAMEGHRFYDLLRWGDLSKRFNELQAADPNFKTFVADNDFLGFTVNKHEWLPIPITEMESNPNAIQNSPLY